MPVEHRPLLAHYTSLEVMAKIVENEEIWFSNPLFMNDHQEVRFGMLNGRAIFDQCFDEPSFVATIDPQMLAIVKRSFHHLFEQFDKNETDRLLCAVPNRAPCHPNEWSSVDVACLWRERPRRRAGVQHQLRDSASGLAPF